MNSYKMKAYDRYHSTYSNSYNSNSLNNESVSQSININDVHYENEENEIDDNV